MTWMPKAKDYKKIMLGPGKEEDGRVVEGGRTSSGDEEITLDDLLEKIPIGRFHYRLLVICGMAFMADAMEVRDVVSS